MQPFKPHFGGNPAAEDIHAHIYIYMYINI